MAHLFYLKTEGRAPIVVQIVETERGYHIQALNNPTQQFELVRIEPRPAAPARPDYDRVLSMSPAEVIAYFEQSPDLYSMAADVKSALVGLEMASESDLQLQQDIEALRGREWASKADISEILTGERTYGGATYRRVSAVFEALSTTTTPKSSGVVGVEERKAA